MPVYVYGIVESCDQLIKESLTGVDGGKVYLLPYLDLAAAVSNLRGKGYQPDQKIILDYQMVIDSLMESFSLLPASILTIFNQESEVIDILKRYYFDFKENFNHLKNKVEFGLKVIWHGHSAQPPSPPRGEGIEMPSPVTLPGDKGLPAGRAYMQQRLAEYNIDKAIRYEAQREIERINSFFMGHYLEKKIYKLISNNLLMKAYYLVNKDKQDEFYHCFTCLKEQLADYHYLFSGPWPPYNFITLNNNQSLLSFPGLSFSGGRVSCGGVS